MVHNSCLPGVDDLWWPHVLPGTSCFRLQHLYNTNRRKRGFVWLNKSALAEKLVLFPASNSNVFIVLLLCTEIKGASFLRSIKQLILYFCAAAFVAKCIDYTCFCLFTSGDKDEEISGNCDFFILFIFWGPKCASPYDFLWKQTQSPILKTSLGKMTFTFTPGVIINRC